MFSARFFVNDLGTHVPFETVDLGPKGEPRFSRGSCSGLMKDIGICNFCEEISGRICCAMQDNSKGVNQQSPGSRAKRAHPGWLTSDLREPQRGSPGGFKGPTDWPTDVDRPEKLAMASVLRLENLFEVHNSSLLTTQGALPLVATLGSVGELLRSSKAMQQKADERQNRFSSAEDGSPDPSLHDQDGSEARTDRRIPVTCLILLTGTLPAAQQLR